MAAPLTDKVFSSLAIIALLFINVEKGSSTFYPPTGVAHLQGHQQAVFDAQEPQNVVGYSYKPAWANIHLQPYIQETVQQAQQQNQEQLQDLIKNHENQPQDGVQRPFIQTYPAHTYPVQQQFEKYQIAQPGYNFQVQKYPVASPDYQIHYEKYQPFPPKYQWGIEPSVQYQLPSISHPLIPRDPQQHNVNVLLPLRVFGVQTFPPFLERLVQRVQNYYSVYNPPDLLTIPYSINTPPTFSASSLVPPDEDVPTQPENNDVNNSVDGDESSTTDPILSSTDYKIDSESEKESSTADPTNEDSSTQENRSKEEDESTTSISVSTDSTSTEESEEGKEKRKVEMSTTVASTNVEDDTSDKDELMSDNSTETSEQTTTTTDE